MDVKDIYMRSVSGYPLLTPEQEIELSDVIIGYYTQEEKDEAINTLVLSNLLLVIHCVNKFYFTCRSVSWMDAVQEGNKGLMDAAKRYDYSKNPVKFCSYAYKIINQRIFSVIEKDRFVRVPSRHNDLFRKIYALEREYGCELDRETIKEKLEVTDKQLDIMEMAKKRTRVIDIDDFELLVSLTDGEKSKNEDSLDNSILREYLENHIKTMTPLAQTVLRRIFFEENELKIIGEDIGISRQAVQQAAQRALKSLRKKIVNDKIEFNDIPIKWIKVMRDEIKPVYRRPNRWKTSQGRRVSCS